jgi:hypothetical protein
MIIKRLLPAVLLSMVPLIGADGDIFPYLFHLYGLGKLVGTRSWGGVPGAACAASTATGCWPATMRSSRPRST